MSSTSSLDPASAIIALLGGVQHVADLVGLSRTRVYRWTQAKERGGTGGVIPIQYGRVLLDHAAEEGIELRAEQFFAEPEPVLTAAAPVEVAA